MEPNMDMLNAFKHLNRKFFTKFLKLATRNTEYLNKRTMKNEKDEELERKFIQK